MKKINFAVIRILKYSYNSCISGFYLVLELHTTVPTEGS